MKFFSEFGSCWGGVTIGSSADSAVVRLEKVNHRGGGAATHNWKPKLNAISENSPLPEVDRGGAVNKPIAGADVKKRPVKAKPKSPARAAPPPNHQEEYWKSSAISAFSPTSFLF